MFVVRTLTFLSEQLSKCLYTQSDKIKIDCVNTRGKNLFGAKTPLFTFTYRRFEYLVNLE